MKDTDLKNKYKQYVLNTYNRYDVTLKQGNNGVCTDHNGKEYIDFTSGIGVNSLGYSDSGWIEAITRQAEAIQNTSNLFYTEPAANVAEKMCKRTDMSKMYFANSGAEANECAIKAARKFSQMKYDSTRHEIITMEGSFHGRTMATITATGQESFHKNFMPLLQGFKYAEVNNTDSFDNCISDKTCAVMLELIQGEGGVNVLQESFVEHIASVCKEKDVLFIVDEIQTGIGRTGKFMAWEHYGIKPDIATVAKGLGSGLPIGGVLFNDKTENSLGPGDHGSTFGGNPVACAGAEYVIDVVDEDFLKQVEKKSELIMENVSSMKGIKSVSGKGLMLGLELEDKKPQDVVNSCIQQGLLVLTAKDKIRLLPPLTINVEDIKKGLQILQNSVK